jgi:hypothetical protein
MKKLHDKRNTVLENAHWSITALSATRKRREAECARKLMRAQQLIEEYGTRRRRFTVRNGLVKDQKGRSQISGSLEPKSSEG